MALFDTTADALAIDVVVPEDHGRVQAWMQGGRALGLILLSLGFGVIFATVLTLILASGITLAFFARAYA